LGAASSVLGGAAGEEDDIFAGLKVGVYAGVLFGGLGEDGVVGLEGVFREEVGAGLVLVGRGMGQDVERYLRLGLDVKEGVLQTEELVGGHDCGCWRWIDRFDCCFCEDSFLLNE
jgi:hypothetical protein